MQPRIKIQTLKSTAGSPAQFPRYSWVRSDNVLSVCNLTSYLLTNKQTKTNKKPTQVWVLEAEQLSQLWTAMLRCCPGNTCILLTVGHGGIQYLWRAVLLFVGCDITLADISRFHFSCESAHLSITAVYLWSSFCKWRACISSLPALAVLKSKLFFVRLDILFWRFSGDSGSWDSSLHLPGQRNVMWTTGWVSSMFLTFPAPIKLWNRY